MNRAEMVQGGRISAVMAHPDFLRRISAATGMDAMRKGPSLGSDGLDPAWTQSRGQSHMVWFWSTRTRLAAAPRHSSAAARQRVACFCSAHGIALNFS